MQCLWQTNQGNEDFGTGRLLRQWVIQSAWFIFAYHANRNIKWIQIYRSGCTQLHPLLMKLAHQGWWLWGRGSPEFSCQVPGFSPSQVQYKSNTKHNTDPTMTQCWGDVGQTFSLDNRLYVSHHNNNYNSFLCVCLCVCSKFQIVHSGGVCLIGQLQWLLKYTSKLIFFSEEGWCVWWIRVNALPKYI